MQRTEKQNVTAIFYNTDILLKFNTLRYFDYISVFVSDFALAQCRNRAFGIGAYRFFATYPKTEVQPTRTLPVYMHKNGCTRNCGSRLYILYVILLLGNELQNGVRKLVVGVEGKRLFAILL